MASEQSLGKSNLKLVAERQIADFFAGSACESSLSTEGKARLCSALLMIKRHKVEKNDTSPD